MAEPLALTTAIITLSNTLQRAITLLRNFANAREKLVEIERDITLTQRVLEYLQQQLESSSPPTLLIDRADGGAGAGRGTGTRDAGINLASILRDNVVQLQLDLDAFVKELTALGMTWHPETRLGRLLANGHVAWRMTYLDAMRHRIVAKRMQLELVRNSLQTGANNPSPERRTSDDSVLIASFLSRLIRRRQSNESDSLPAPSIQNQENLVRIVRTGTRRELEVVLQRVSPNFSFGSRERYPLHIAAVRGDLGIVNLLISRAATVDYCTRDGETPLMFAISRNHPVVALALIRQGANMRLSDAQGRTPLHLAAKGNLYAVTQVLLNNGADVNAQDADGRTPLMEALCRSDRDIQPHDTSVLRVLTEPRRDGQAAADPTYGLMSSHYTPLHHAAAQGYLEDLEIMMTAPESLGAATRLVLDSKQRTPLWFAAKHGHIDIINLLISLGADVNHRSRDGTNPTALWAIANSDSPSPLDGVSALLTANANPNVPDPSGQTLLHKSCQSGNVPLLTLLLSHNADPLVRDTSSLLPIHHAARAGHEQCITHLLTHPSAQVLVNTLDNLPDPPSQTNMMTMMINVPDNTGITPLILASEHGHDFLVRSLITGGADHTHRDQSGCDAFYVACARGHLLCAAYLLGAGAELNGQTGKGNTALHVAARVGGVEVVGWLLRMGADREVRSVERFEGMEVVGTAADIAKGAGLEGGLGERIARLIEGWDEGGRRGVRYKVERVTG